MGEIFRADLFRYQSYLKLDQRLLWYMGFPTSVGRDSCREKNSEYTEVQRTLVDTGLQANLPSAAFLRKLGDGE